MFDSWWTCVSLVPRPRLAFHRFQYVKVERAWYLFSCEHDVIDNGPKILNHKAKFHVLYNELQVQHYMCITYSRPALARYLWKVTWYLSSSCCSKPRCAHSQLSPFYHLSTLDVMHVIKDTRPSTFLVQLKTAWAWERVLTWVYKF